MLLATFGNMRWGELAGLRRRYLDLVSRVVNPLAVVALLGALAKLLQVREGNAQVAVRLEWQRIAFRGSQKDIKRASRGCQAGIERFHPHRS